MPRARNLKPGFFKDAKVVACSFPARLLFEGLWCLADYKGRLKYVPIEIKMELFPADDVDVESLIGELTDQGLIQIYRDHSGSALVQVTNFELHQNPHQNERFGKDKKPLPCLPGPDECLPDESTEKSHTKQEVEDALRVLREYSESNPADSLLLIPDSCTSTEGVSPDGDSPGDESPDSEKPKRFVASKIELPDEVNHDAWLEWCAFRSKRRKPVSEDAAVKQIKLLREHTKPVQQQIVDHSIQNDYQGLFEPKGNPYANTAGNPGRSTPRRQTAADRLREQASRL